MKRRDCLALGLSGAGWIQPAVGAQAADGAERVVKVAWISPQSGTLAAFGVGDLYAQQRLAPRLLEGNPGAPGGRRKIEVILLDSGSSSTRAAELAAQAIAGGADLLLATATPEMTNPVASTCEKAGVPCVSSIAPWQAWFHGRGGKMEEGFKWTFHFFGGLEDFAEVYSGLFAKARLGRQVGGVFGDDVDAEAFLKAFPKAMAAQNLELVVPQRVPFASPDWVGLATRLKDANVAMLTGVLPPPSALDFMAAARKVGYQPRMVSFAKALLFPDTVARLAAPGLVLTNELWWSPAWPFKSALTGETAKDLVAEYERKTGRQWTQMLGFSHALMEVAYGTVQSADSVSREGLRQALARLQLPTLVGPLSFRGRLPAPNVCTTPAVGGQWQQSPGGRWELQVVDNTRSPFIPVTQSFKV